MILSERIEKITSNKEEYEELYNSDNLYIVWAQSTDYEKLNKFVNEIDGEYYSWQKELRGEKRSESKVDGTTGVLQGYVISVTKDQMDMFEKVALMPSMRYGYRFDKLDLNSIKDKEKEEIFSKLSEEE